MVDPPFSKKTNDVQLRYTSIPIQMPVHNIHTYVVPTRHTYACKIEYLTLHMYCTSNLTPCHINSNWLTELRHLRRTEYIYYIFRTVSREQSTAYEINSK